MPSEPKDARAYSGIQPLPIPSDPNNFMKQTLLNAAILCGCSIAGVASAAATDPAAASPAAPTYTAGEVRGQLAVELTIGKGCEVVNGSAKDFNSFGTLSFGEVSALTQNFVDAQAKGSGGAVVKLNCTQDVPYRVSLDDGRNASGEGARRLALVGGTTAAYVPYYLYQDAARKTVWDSKNPYTGSGKGAAEEMVVYGRIPPMAATPASGKYADVVMLTVSW
ncbi:spore coat protein [Streptomyces cavourensis]|jgi:spore coat protein U-like protein|nr:spore coat protein [Streptomyces cavourensis]